MRDTAAPSYGPQQAYAPPYAPMPYGPVYAPSAYIGVDGGRQSPYRSFSEADPVGDVRLRGGL
jgi:hypothetical protein